MHNGLCHFAEGHFELFGLFGKLEIQLLPQDSLLEFEPMSEVWLSLLRKIQDPLYFPHTQVRCQRPFWPFQPTRPNFVPLETQQNH